MRLLLVTIVGLALSSCSPEARYAKQAVVISSLGNSYTQWVTNTSVQGVEASLRKALNDASASIEQKRDHLLLLRTRGNYYLLCWSYDIREVDLESASVIVACSIGNRKLSAASPKRETYLVSFPGGGCAWLKSTTPPVPGCVYGGITNGWHRPLQYPAAAVSNLEACYPDLKYGFRAGNVVMTDTY